jgi:hypothetical protein
VGWNWYSPGPYAYPSYAYPPYYSYYSYYSYYYPYSPPVVVVPAAPSTYIEQQNPEAAQAAPASNDWYYCRKPEGYYPYVRQCPGGWQRVPAQPQQ